MVNSGKVGVGLTGGGVPNANVWLVLPPPPLTAGAWQATSATDIILSATTRMAKRRA
jgi:hypothetical protein